MGDRLVDAIDAKDLRNWFDDLSVTRTASASRALAVLWSMMKHADALGLRREDSNPCKGLRRRKTGFEAHYLTDDEFAALGRALDGAEADHPVAVAVVRFRLYTSARKQARRAVDRERALLFLDQDARCGRGRGMRGCMIRAMCAPRTRS